MKTIQQQKISFNLIDNLLIGIPEGTVEMRDDRINKIWSVNINSFLLAKIPVTQGFYERITNECPSAFKGEDLPVESVTWVDAVYFCNKLSEYSGLMQYYSIDPATEEILIDQNANGFRLPTEAEWQYACQAGSNKNRYDDLQQVAWYKENSNGRTQNVGKKEPNAWGLYDMLGNVWEWCSDIYDETVYGSYRIFRGGGWCDERRSVMATTRRRSHPFSFKIDDLGFRIARSIKQNI